MRTRERMHRDQLRSNAERRPIIRYPSGHVLFINREHVTRALDAKAALAIDLVEGEPVSRAMGAGR